jgi:hypothetical protein
MNDGLYRDEIRYVQYLASVYERKAWDASRPGRLPHKGPAMHAMALRIACGQTRDHARDHLIRAKPSEQKEAEQ